jgi:hypothetical protein
MHLKDYLPQTYALLLNWIMNFPDCVSANRIRFGIPEAKVEILLQLSVQYQRVQRLAEMPNAGKADRLNRKETAMTVKKAVRDFANANLRYNEAVTDEDRVNMRLNIRDPKPTPAPDTQPIDTAMIMRITLHFKNTGSTAQAKPHGMHDVEIRWAVLDRPPTLTEELCHSEFSTRSSRTLIFDENRRGKTVRFRLRRENTRGEKGLWSEFYSAVIP